MPTIEIYTQPWCPYCVRAKNLLDSKGVAYTEIEAPGGSPQRAESLARSGSTSVPQVFVNGTHIGDSDRLAALERAGKLGALLNP
jgi:glutaredoxin 3